MRRRGGGGLDDDKDDGVDESDEDADESEIGIESYSRSRDCRATGEGGRG